MDVTSSQNDGVLTVSLNRPDRGNGVSDEMARSLTEVLQTAESVAKLVVLRGNGADFCTGRASGGPPPVGAEALSRRRDFQVIFDCYAAFRECNLPIVGVVQGQALGLG